jgi:hypothetical protein
MSISPYFSLAKTKTLRLANFFDSIHSFRIIFLLTISLTMSLALTHESKAQEAEPSEPPYLFMTAENAQDIKVRESPMIVRSHLVNIDFSLLPDPDENFMAEPDSEIPLILNFFSEVEFTVLIQKIEKNRSGSYSWYGKLEDIPMSQVVLVVNQNRVTGNISKQKKNYQVRHIADGIHVIHEIDPSKFPPTSEPITPGKKSQVPLSPSKTSPKISEDSAKSSAFDESPASDQDAFPKSGLGYGISADAPLSGITTIPDTLSTSDTSSSSATEVQPDDGTSIDVLVVYTAEARAVEGGTSAIESLIDLAESETNAAYSNSGVAHVIRVVAKQEINFSESGFSFVSFLNSAQNGSISGLSDLRDTNGADLVVVLVDGDDSACGLGFLMSTVSSTFAPFGYSVTQTNCATGNFTFGHEIGHNMSARHDRANDSTDGSPFDFNHGFVDDTNGFKTIMGTGSNTRIQNFSNPNILFGGAATGVAEGNALAADNRLTFQNTSLTVSNFRQSIDSAANQAFTSIVPFSNSSRVISPYWQSDESSYSFVAVTHPSVSNMASQVGVVVRAIKNDGTLFGSATSFTIDRGVTNRIFIVRSTHPTINSTSLTDVELVTGSSIFQHGFLHFNPVASNPETSVNGFRDITRLSYWGAVVLENNTTGFAMEFIGDTQDSAATPTMANSATVSGIN